MLDWAFGGLGKLFGWVGDAAGEVVGWAWEKVIRGIYTWLANGLALLIEWVWGVLDSASTPRVTDAWFRNELAGRVGLIALAVTIAMMLASAMQAALAGRPEQIGDAVKEGVKAIVASALTLTVIDVLVRITDEASAMVWQVSRPDLVRMLESMVEVTMATGALGQTFVGPLCLLFGYIGLLGLAVALMMRSALIYVAAALAPIVWSTSILPLFRGSARKLVHLTVALIVSKLAIVITLSVAVKLATNASGDPNTSKIANDGAAAVGMLVSGFVCFLIAAVTPIVLYKLMPTVEGAVVASGVAGGWGRGVTTAAHTALMVKSLGAASAATRAVAGQSGVAGSHTASGGPGAIGGLGTPVGGTQDPPTEASSEPSRGQGSTAPTAPTTPATRPGPPPATRARPREERPRGDDEPADRQP